MPSSNQDLRKLSDIEKIIQKAKGKLTLAEISAETGLAIEDARANLNVLLERYQSKIQMDNETGNLLFNFQYPLLRRDNVTFKERMLKIGDNLLKAFKVIYKASLGIVLIAYTIFFALLIIIASSRSDSNDNKSGRMVSELLRAVFKALWIKNTFSPEYQYEYQNDGKYRYKKVIKPQEGGKGFIASVFSFVFGPEKPKYDPKLDTLEAISFIRENGGKINTSDIVALSGVDFSVAESRLAEYSGKFNGEMYISNLGTVTAEFPQLMDRFSSELSGGKIEFYKNEIEPPVEFTGNTAGKNTLISVMNAFNLIMSMYIIGLTTAGESTFMIWAGVFPLVISILYFTIPIIRFPFYIRDKKKRRKNILRKEIMGYIMENKGQNIRLENIHSKIQENEYTREEIQDMLMKTAGELQGETAINDNGEAVFQFPRIAKELA